MAAFDVSAGGRLWVFGDSLIGLVPIVGGIVLVLACVMGIGAFALSVAQVYRRSRAPAGALAPAPTPLESHVAAA